MATDPKLLTRDQFRASVFARDGHTCVFCGSKAADAHHIIERKLWGNGGYYLDNGASVCEPCHLKCESTEFSVELVREKCGITRVIVPDHLYADQKMDKWGNSILPNGQRLKGELFFEEGVQKVIAPYLGDFTNLCKYPRSHHLAWSPGLTEDDRVIPHTKDLDGHRVIVTEKMDGENTSLYRDTMHARSVDSRHHVSRDWVKQFHAGIAQDIPEGWRICGENVFAQHSIAYDSLPTYFLGFSVWNQRNMCLSWDETQEWFQLLGVTSVPVLYDGVYDEDIIRNLAKKLDFTKNEGYVVRRADSFSYSQFRTHLAKFVRPSHVQTNRHWSSQAVIKNKLG